MLQISVNFTYFMDFKEKNKHHKIYNSCFL